MDDSLLNHAIRTMHFDQVIMDKALEAGMGEEPVIRLTKLVAKEIEWLQSNIPIPGFREYLMTNAFADEYQFCAHNVYSVRLMMKHNNDDFFRGLTKGYLVIGSAPNGDSIAIDRAKHEQIGFIGHEDPDNWSFVGVDTSISDFFWKSWNQEDYPSDFFQAEDAANKSL